MRLLHSHQTTSAAELAARVAPKLPGQNDKVVKDYMDHHPILSRLVKLFFGDNAVAERALKDLSDTIRATCSGNRNFTSLPGGLDVHVYKTQITTQVSLINIDDRSINTLLTADLTEAEVSGGKKTKFAVAIHSVGGNLSRDKVSALTDYMDSTIEFANSAKSVLYDVNDSSVNRHSPEHTAAMYGATVLSYVSVRNGRAVDAEEEKRRVNGQPTAPLGVIEGNVDRLAFTSETLSTLFGGSEEFYEDGLKDLRQSNSEKVLKFADVAKGILNAIVEARTSGELNLPSSDNTATFSERLGKVYTDYVSKLGGNEQKKLQEVMADMKKFGGEEFIDDTHGLMAVVNYCRQASCGKLASSAIPQLAVLQDTGDIVDR